MKSATVAIALLATTGASAFIGVSPPSAASIAQQSQTTSPRMSATKLHATRNNNDSDSSARPSTALSASTLADADQMNAEAAASAADSAVEMDYVEQQKSYLDDGFVFGMEGSGLERPKGKSANVVLEGDTLETQPYQVAAVVTTFLGQAYFATSAIAHMSALNDGNLPVTSIEALATVVASWVLADLGSGILHWSVDNYGNGRTPIMGGIIAAFQGHHSAQWTITYRGFCNNVYKLCVPFGIPTVAVINALAGPNHPEVTLFFAIFCALEILSQEFHKWSHQPKNEVPSWVNFLMNSGLTINRTQHSQHHRAPYKGNYCIVSGACNELLDESGFFRRLEHVVYELNGVESNAWKLDGELRERTLRGQYGLPESRRQ